jgi:23S rRNA U2552 (ribose-2'-O)-methylase RlmE/FtsJ
MSNVVQDPVSRAYFKMIEIIRTNVIKPPTESLHLCEAPGGFAQAVLSLHTAHATSLLTNGGLFRILQNIKL